MAATENTYTRREFLKKLRYGAKKAAKAAIVVSGVAAIYELPFIISLVSRPTLTDGPLCDKDLNLARKYRFLRDDFCQKVYEAAQAQGLLKFCSRILYDEYYRESRVYVSEVCAARGVPDEAIKDVLRVFDRYQHIDDLIRKGSPAPKRGIPDAHVVSFIQMVGRSINSPIFVSRYLFDGGLEDPQTENLVPVHNNIDEVLSTIADHEGKHTADVSGGYYVGDGMVLDYQKFEALPPSFLRFKHALVETRGYYAQLFNLCNHPKVRDIYRRVLINISRKPIIALASFKDTAIYPKLAPYAHAQLENLEGVVVHPDSMVSSEAVKFTFLGEK